MQNVNATIASEYSQSARLTALIEAFNTWIDPSAELTNLITLVLDLDTAVGYGLDRIGRVVGITRVLPVSGTSYSLSDAAYRGLLFAKCASNISDGSIESINAILMALFPGTGDNYVVDNENMTFALHLAFTPSPVQSAMLVAAGTMPRSAGVEMTVPGGSSGSLAVSIGSGAAETEIAPMYDFGSVAAVVTGGSGSYAYAWSLVSPVGTWAISSLTGIATVLSVSGVAPGATATVTLNCVVTDTLTGGTASANANYSLDNSTVPGTFNVAIQPGQVSAGKTEGFTFAPNRVTPTGGVAPYSFAWAIQSTGPSGTWAITGPATDAVVPSVSGAYSGGSAGLTCTATDANGDSVTSAPSIYVYVQVPPFGPFRADIFQAG